MAKLYQLDVTQLRFLQYLVTNPSPPKLDTLSGIEECDVNTIVEILQEEGYFLKTESGNFFPEEGLEFLLAVAKDPWGSFVMEDDKENKESFYFQNDIIVCGPLVLHGICPVMGQNALKEKMRK